MASTPGELEERIKYTPPKDRKATEKLYWAVNAQLEFGVRLLKPTNWWVGWIGGLLGKPILTINPKIGTACVSINPNNGKIEYYFNLFFAASLSAGDIAYIIAHEAMHISWKHLQQITTMAIKYPKVWNWATDALINEFLDSSLRFGSTIEQKDRMDWITNHGIRWKDLPQSVQDKYPMEKQLSRELECSAFQVYLAMLEDMKKTGVDPNSFTKKSEETRHGQIVKRKNHNTLGQTKSSEEVTHQDAMVEPGDVVYIKSTQAIGIIKEIRLANASSIDGKADVETYDDLTEEEYVWLSRACWTGKKSYAKSKKIVDAYAKMKTAGKLPDNYTQLGKAAGVPEIGQMDTVDAEIDQWKADHPIMTQAEVDALQDKEDEDLEAKAVANAKRYKQQIARGNVGQ